jgi:hypothetical protein
MLASVHVVPRAEYDAFVARRASAAGQIDLGREEWEGACMKCHRLDSAYYASLAVLCVGIAASLIKGFDYEEALILTAVLLAAGRTRRSTHSSRTRSSSPAKGGS